MCTTMIITKSATTDGSMMVTHSDDDELGDQRIVFIPAMNHPPNARRKVFAERYRYPRIVTDDRGPGYDTPGFEPNVPLGSIPQAAHTYGYFDGNYGIMNEHNLMIGECTNAANHQPSAVSKVDAQQKQCHCRLLYSQELSRISLERCTTARESILLMGELIEKYGLYSTGETLLIADENEAWVFEMCALPDDEFHSVWVAQLVPDGEVFVAANEFRIREVTETNENQLFSRFLKPGLTKLGWWKPENGPLDWLRCVSPGEYNHPYYSLRRVWRVLDRINPDLALSPWVKDGYTTAYPFSIRPNRKLSLEDVFALYRDHYEGTEFDLTRGIAAGPYGDPNRFTASYDGNQNNVTQDKRYYGAWERAISVFYQGYTYVNQLRPHAPVATRGITWFGPDVAYTTCFTPFPSKVLHLPAPYQHGDPQTFERRSAWWAFDFVANWTRLNYQRITQIDIRPLQTEIESSALQFIRELDKRSALLPEEEARVYMTQAVDVYARALVDRWWQLGDTLVAKYSDGYVNLPGDRGPYDVGYSATWLNRTNYGCGPTSYDMKVESSTTPCRNGT